MAGKATYEELERRVKEFQQAEFERKQGKEELREHSEMLENIINGVSMLITYVDREERYVFVNSAYADWYGVSREELLGKKVSNILSPDAYERAAGNIKKALSGQRVSYTNKVIAKDGSERYVNANYYPHCIKNEVKGFITTIVDITDRIKEDKSLRLQETIINFSSSAIVACDLDCNISYANPTFLQKWGFVDPAEFLGRPFWNFWAVKHRLDEILQALKDEGVWFGELQAIRKDGTFFDVLVSAAAVFDSKGNPFALTSTSTDITERKNAEKKQIFQRNFAIGLNKTLTLEETLSEILLNAFQLDEFDSGGIYLFDEKTNGLILVSSKGLPQTFVDEVKYYDLNDIRVQMIMKGIPFFLPTCEFPMPIRESLEKYGLLAIAVFPIKFRETVIGSINLASRTHVVTKVSQ